MVYINPDNYLGSPRVWSAERGMAAWQACYKILENVLRSSKSTVNLYVVCGVQGAGKTHWVMANTDSLPQATIVFDAALPGARHRARAIEMASSRGIKSIGVWINVPLVTAMTQNLLRPVAEQVPEETLTSVFNNFEPPTTKEGFHKVIEVRRELAD